MSAGASKLRRAPGSWVVRGRGRGRGIPYEGLQVLVRAGTEEHLDHRRVAFLSPGDQGRAFGLLGDRGKGKTMRRLRAKSIVVVIMIPG